MSDLAILVPVLQRPHRVRPLVETIVEATPDAEVLFVTDPDDREEHAAIREIRSVFPVTTVVRSGGWAHKINEAVRVTDRPFMFLGADDLEFKPGWYEEAQAMLDGTVQVVGVNDLIRRRRVHTTHFLVTREYALRPCADGSRGPVCELYDHSWVDDELIATARHRGAYAYAQRAHVKHLHPFGGSGQDDDVYRKGRAEFHTDRAIFERRQALWT